MSRTTESASKPQTKEAVQRTKRAAGILQKNLAIFLVNYHEIHTGKYTSPCHTFLRSHPLRDFNFDDYYKKLNSKTTGGNRSTSMDNAKVTAYEFFDKFFGLLIAHFKTANYYKSEFTLSAACLRGPGRDKTHTNFTCAVFSYAAAHPEDEITFRELFDWLTRIELETRPIFPEAVQKKLSSLILDIRIAQMLADRSEQHRQKVPTLIAQKAAIETAHMPTTLTDFLLDNEAAIAAIYAHVVTHSAKKQKQRIAAEDFHAAEYTITDNEPVTDNPRAGSPHGNAHSSTEGPLGSHTAIFGSTRPRNTPPSRRRQLPTDGEASAPKTANQSTPPSAHRTVTYKGVRRQLLTGGMVSGETPTTQKNESKPQWR